MSQIVSVGDTKLLAGLYWSRLQSPRKKRRIIRGELQELASEYRQVFNELPTIGALHSNGIDLLMGVGEGSADAAGLNKKAKVYSLACLVLLANPGQRSFIGRLRLMEGQEWVLVVRSGIISPIGDTVKECSDENDFYEVIRKRNSDLNVIFDETDTEASNALIEGWLDRVSFKKIPKTVSFYSMGAPPMGTKSIILYGVIALLAVSGIYTGFSQYQSYVDEKKAQEMSRRQAAIDRLNSGASIPKPWTEWPTVGAVASACLINHQQKDDYRYGWKEVYWNCDGVNVTRNWERTDAGSYAFLPVEDAFNIANPNEIGHKEPLGINLEARSDQPIPPKKDAGKVIMDAARLHGMAVRLKWGNEASRTYMQDDKKVVEPFGYSLNEGTISGNGTSGLSIINTLRKIPGLRIKRLSEEGTDFEIKIEFYTAV